ncbi:ribosomal RNA small subunit methyltransferase I [Candidatus Moduliflexus flocculans]|uniref:Ribosomal RNA small subunit methyltransferase I n=1 Tax=Candidatus Moduliflexus flocculans TaxID=1499966 RepID=A0A0S6VXS3_9BACT|nr:ribosomal RNA small subunit methyltransferase I [Candidatus Moduliflexus flocculans]
MNSPGTLYIVSTPIGNLEDITLRALRILKEVALIAAEDTRHTRKLLSAYDIHTPLTSYFEHNEAQKTGYLLDRLRTGESIALVSDAGTPGISDPGHDVICAAIAAQIPVVPIPGASAALSALVVSGLPTDAFLFIGFLTNKRSARIKQLNELRDESRTIICYVSPHAFLATLQDILEIFGNRQMMAAREITKKFEEFARGDVESVIAHFYDKADIKGELTLVIAGAQPVATEEMDDDTLREALRCCIETDGMSRKDAVKSVVETFGVAKNRAYQLSLSCQTC